MCRPIAMALAFAAMLTPGIVRAATRLVNPGGSDSGNCTVNPCGTLSYAIAQAVNGDTISVGQGTYNNGFAMVVVNKSVALRGAQAGVDGRTRSFTLESILTEPVQIAADGVVLDGFTISCSSCNPALSTSSAFSGYSIINNIITANEVGMTFGSSGATTSTVAFNKIFDNNLGPVQHYGIFSDVAVTNAVIDRNVLSGHDTAQIDFARFPPQSAATVTISNNSFPLDSTDGVAVILVGNTGSVISGNTITGGAAAFFGGIFLAGGDNNITVTGNRVIGTPRDAILIWDFFFQLGVPFNGLVTITGNTLVNNDGGVNTMAGNSVPPEMHVNRIVNNTFDIKQGTFIHGENNWFGCNAGPPICATISANGPLDVAPWLLMGISPNPLSITTAQTSSVEAFFFINSNNEFVPGFPDGATVVFSASGGTMTPPSNPTIGSLVVSTFTPSVPGLATVSATLDDQTVSANVMVTAVADVGIAGSVSSPSFATVPMTKTFTVTNHGPDTASGIVLTDTLPAGLTLNSAPPSCSGTSTVTCNIGTLASGASATIALSVTASAPGPFSNTASVSTTATDNNTANNSTTVNSTVLPASAIPALSPLMLALLAALLAALALVTMRTG